MAWEMAGWVTPRWAAIWSWVMPWTQARQISWSWSWTGSGRAPGAHPRRVPLPLQLALDVPAAGPGPDHVEPDPALDRSGQDPGTRAVTVLGQAPVQVDGRAQVVAGRPVRMVAAQPLVEVDQVAHRG